MVASTSSSAPLVTVIGATGNQGGSVIRALLESDKPYRLRGITRDSSKPQALKLKEQSVELVNADITPGGSESLVKAFEGSAYVFGMTDCANLCCPRG
jgi:uncharacterized protein YbjT (DUF2867 family)